MRESSGRTRRGILVGAGAAVTASLAGCSGLPFGDDEATVTGEQLSGVIEESPPSIPDRLPVGTGKSYLDGVASELDSALASVPTETTVERFDVADYDAVAATFEAIAERYGSPTVLVNNAGTVADGLLVRMTPEQWQRVVDVNLTGTFHCTREAARQMLRRDDGGGRIVNISSSVVTMGVPGFLHYVASKGAVLAMTRAMATEIGDLGIRVNAVMPGFTWSEASQQAGEEYLEEYVAKQDLQRVVEPEDIAGVVAFLAGPDSGIMTGQAISADPGLSYY